MVGEAAPYPPTLHVLESNPGLDRKRVSRAKAAASSMPPADDAIEIFLSVTSDDDLWGLVLSFLPLRNAVIAANACRGHYCRVLGLSRRQIHNVNLAMVANFDDETGSDIGLFERPPALRILESPTQGELLESFGQFRECSRPKGDDAWVIKYPLLSSVVSLLPRLQMLQISLNPTQGKGSVITSISENLIWLDPAVAYYKSGDIGVVPRLVLGCPRLCEIEFCLHANVHSSQYHAIQTSAQATYNLHSLFLVLIVGSWRRLLRLNIRGIAPLVVETLLQVQLPCLAVLQCGDCDAHALSGQADVTWPNDLLPRLSAAFPSLVGLDVAHMITSRGVSYADVGSLCQNLHSLQHLDLSQVMTFVDFGLGLITLAARAPSLRSLAIQGLHTPDAPLLQLGTHCTLLRRLNLIHCKYTPKGLGAFLRVASNLAHLDLSGGVAPTAELREWIRERARVKPVLSLFVIACEEGVAIASDVATEQEERGVPLDRRLPLVVTRGSRPSLLDAVLSELGATGEAIRDEGVGCLDEASAELKQERWSRSAVGGAQAGAFSDSLS